MTKQIRQNELDAVLSAVGQFPEGASVKDVSTVMEKLLSRRTLQRRLGQLVAQKKLILKGRGRGSRYIEKVRLSLDATLPTLKGESHAEVYIPVSRKGEQIKQAVRKPVQNRQPVGYNRKFIDDYIPNTTFYLSHEIRQRLYEMGQSLDDCRPAGTYARQIFNRILIDLSWNSSRLEGNTYSLLETDRLLEFGEVAEGKQAKESQMILNHKAAIELLVGQAREVGFNSYTICNLHALLSDNLLTDPGACGRLRAIPVGISGTVYIPLEMPQLIKEFFLKLLEKATAIENPFEQAFFAMIHLPYLQPFEDVNKRVSRLSANIPLIRENLCPLSFVDVPEQAYIDGLMGMYELNRTELLRDVFIWAYERSCARYSAVRSSLGEPDPFRLRHRTLIFNIVNNVVLGVMNKKMAVSFIKQSAVEKIELKERDRLVEVIETELMGLHDGNIARYRIRPSEYEKWRITWTAQ
ncbi:Fic family protein [Desulfobacula sp.]|uniref:Fic family protein n=1 Tax=Desulfobacula sp. TaxID=2593537 RepID=UPI0025C10CB6|nr:Fic family protein [Desulfobacula sp.]MBC2705895.1 Fic family protein [Desulfobacula sp.]